MRKRLSIKTRRPDLSRSEFRHYYENRHVPLGLSFIEHFRWLRYVRNHIRSTRGGLVTFDCYAEFWVDDDADDEALYRFLRSEDFRRLDLDDRNFLDISRRLSFEVRETVLFSTRSALPAQLQKMVLMWKQAANPRDSAESVAARVVDHLKGSIHRASLDVALPPLPEEAPFDAFLAIEYSGESPPDIDASLLPGDRWSQVQVDTVETPRDKLIVEPA